MTANPADLIVELRVADGTSAEYYQTDGECIREAVRLLAAPRLFAQPHLMLASDQGASMVPCRGIAMIIARTSVPIPLTFPLALPAGRLDIVEWPAEGQDTGVMNGGPELSIISRLAVRTLGGWRINLKVVAIARGNRHDERQLFAHLLNLPAIPFRLREGGIGLINPKNITAVNAQPKPDALPGTALPLALRRWTPSHPAGLHPGSDAPR